MPLLGAHMSVAGGLHLALERLQRVNGEALQIFTRNQRQWRAVPVTAEEAVLFREAWQAAGKPPIAAHDSYLINLASPRKEIAERSTAALADELGRCAALAIPFLVMHPGAHLGDGVEEGISRFAGNLDQALESAAGAGEVMVLLENTAGQGTSLGARFEELAAIIDQSRYPARLGVCLDTCHTFAAGYDLRTTETYEATFAEFARLLGLDRLKFFHLNDSSKGLGSRVDRHAHIGQGVIGLAGFRLLMNDGRFSHHPMTLETPKGEEMLEDIENLAVLRSLYR
ncbi:MAG: deoxyribonuclease IV [Deltaproteobacteria bacterium RIFOXYD12_FULL_57_12]|nr:MAG: deoxyribonuclease IV [Deltaproteobacteria bacterium RIFOXYD12_FULL_57_12]